MTVSLVQGGEGLTELQLAESKPVYKTEKVGIKNKRLTAALDTDYLEKVLFTK